MEFRNGERKLIYGTGSFESASGIVKDSGGSRPLIVSSPFFRSTGFYRKLVESLGTGYEEFYEITEGPQMAEVEHLAEAYRNKGCDFLISVGNSSVISAAKVMKYYFAHDSLHLAIPCTLSVLSFSHWAEYRLGDETEHLVDQALVPESTILDPAATLETEESAWHSSGMEVMDYALSALMQPGIDTDVEDLLLSSLETIMVGLPGKSMEARMELMLSTWYSRVDDYSISADPMNELRNKLKRAIDVPPEMINSIVIPATVIELEARNPEALAKLAKRLGFKGNDMAELGQGARELVSSFLGKLGVSRMLDSYGFGENEVSEALAGLNLEGETLKVIMSAVESG